jgi:hypothetical protein
MCGFIHPPSALRGLHVQEIISVTFAPSVPESVQ